MKQLIQLITIGLLGLFLGGCVGNNDLETRVSRLETMVNSFYDTAKQTQLDQQISQFVALQQQFNQAIINRVIKDEGKRE